MNRWLTVCDGCGARHEIDAPADAYSPPLPEGWAFVGDGKNRQLPRHVCGTCLSRMFGAIPDEATVPHEATP